MAINSELVMMKLNEAIALTITLVAVGISGLGCRNSNLDSYKDDEDAVPVCGREAYWDWAADPANIRSARDAALRGDRSAVESLIYHCSVTMDTEGLVRWLSVGSALGIGAARESLDAIEDADGRLRPPEPYSAETDQSSDPFAPQ